MFLCTFFFPKKLYSQIKTCHNLIFPGVVGTIQNTTTQNTCGLLMSVYVYVRKISHTLYLEMLASLSGAGVNEC